MLSTSDVRTPTLILLTVVTACSVASCQKTPAPAAAPATKPPAPPPAAQTSPPPEPATSARERQPSGSLSQALVNSLLAGRDPSTVPTVEGPATGMPEGPAADQAADKIASFVEPFGKNGRRVREATDADVKALQTALQKILSDNSATGGLTALSGLYPPELLLGFQDDEVPDGRIGWYLDDVGTAAMTASSHRLPLVMVSCDNLNVWCGRLVHDVMPCPAVNRFAGHAVFLWTRPSLDATSQALASHMTLTTLPVISIFLPDNGGLKWKTDLGGFMPAEQLSRLLEQQMGPGGTEDEARALAAAQSLFPNAVQPQACGDTNPFAQ